MINKDVIFYKIAMVRGSFVKETNPIGHQSSDIQVELEIDNNQTPKSLSSSQIKSSAESNPEASAGPSDYYIAKDRSRRNIKPSQRYFKVDFIAYILNVVEDIDCSEKPSTYSEAISCLESRKWITVMHKEM